MGNNEKLAIQKLVQFLNQTEKGGKLTAYVVGFPPFLFVISAEGGWQVLLER